MIEPSANGKVQGGIIADNGSGERVLTRSPARLELIVGAAVYFFVVVPMSRFNRQTKAAEVPSTRKCPECLSMVPLQARRCAYCTATISPVTSLTNKKADSRGALWAHENRLYVLL
jgi:hypothetical protein